MFARKEVQQLVEPLVVSWGYGNDPKLGTGSRYVDILQWTGTKDPAAALTVPAALQFMQEHDWSQVQRECHTLLRQAIERICQLTRLLPPYPLDSDLYIQMGIAPLPKIADLTVLKSRLYDEFKVEVPLTQWRDRQFVRISIQGYNTQEDVDALVDGLRALLPEVQVP